MTGSSIFDYVHRADYEELADQLGLTLVTTSPCSSDSSEAGEQEAEEEEEEDRGGSNNPKQMAANKKFYRDGFVMSSSAERGYHRCFCIRMKSTLTKRGVHIKSSGYRVVQISAHLRPQTISSPSSRKLSGSRTVLGLTAMAVALPSPTITEMIMDNDTFVLRLSPQLKITYCEPRMSEMLDLSNDDLLNRSLYDHCHAEDLMKLHSAHTHLLNKGQSMSDYYRLMTKHGGHIWVQTCATIICNSKNSGDQNIIAINYILSGSEMSGYLMDINQYRAGSTPTKHSYNESTSTNPHHMAHTYNFSEEINSCTAAHQLTCKTSNHDTVKNINKSNISQSSMTHIRDSAFVSLIHNNTNGDIHQENPGPRNNQSKTHAEKPAARKRNCVFEESQNSRKREKVDKNGQPHWIDTVKQEAKQPLAISLEKDAANSSSQKICPPELRKLRSLSPEDLTVKSVETSLCSDIIRSDCMHGWMDGASLISPQSSSIATHPANNSSYVAAQYSTESFLNDSNVKGQSSVHSYDCSSERVLPNHYGTSERFPLNNALDASNNHPTVTQTSSVRDLEQAMIKHLPPRNGDTEKPGQRLTSATSEASNGLSKNRSTASSTTGLHNSASYLPATTLLRSLYANRESVIRSNVYVPRPQYQNESLLASGDEYEDYKYMNCRTPLAGAYGILEYSDGTADMDPISDHCVITPPSSISPNGKYEMSQFHASDVLVCDHRLLSYERGPDEDECRGQEGYSVPVYANCQLTPTYENCAANGCVGANDKNLFYNFSGGSLPMLNNNCGERNGNHALIYGSIPLI